MRHQAVSLADLARPPLDVARGLAAWERGDPDDAAEATLDASQRNLHARAYTCWVWAARDADGVPLWLLPVSTVDAARFAPKGPAAVLARTVWAAAQCGADANAASAADWRGHVALRLPGLDEELAATAIEEVHPPPARGALAELPAGVTVHTKPLALQALDGDGGEGVLGLARALRVHPLRVALALAAHGQPPHEVEGPDLLPSLREWGCDGGPPPPPPAPSLAIEDDPCPRRRHARKVLQRLLRMGKVGAQYHTEFDHLYRGAAPDERRDALAIGEALLRAGLLREKPSVGQRHVYLAREALPQIHALIERGETSDLLLATEWTAPAPGLRADGG